MPQNRACIVGIVDTLLENGRVPGGATVMQIQARAARDALADAGLEWKDVDGLLVAGS